MDHIVKSAIQAMREAQIKKWAIKRSLKNETKKERLQQPTSFCTHPSFDVIDETGKTVTLTIFPYKRSA